MSKIVAPKEIEYACDFCSDHPKDVLGCFIETPQGEVIAICSFCLVRTMKKIVERYEGVLK